MTARILFTIILLLVPVGVFAGVVGVSHTDITLIAHGSEVTSTAITITNKEQISQQCGIELEDKTNTFSEQIRIAPQTFVLAPAQQQNIHISARGVSQELTTTLEIVCYTNHNATLAIGSGIRIPLTILQQNPTPQVAGASVVADDTTHWKIAIIIFDLMLLLVLAGIIYWYKFRTVTYE